MEGAATDILVLPFFGQGHLFPCAELCKRLSSPHRKSILIIPSHLSSSIPSDLHRHPFVHVSQIPPLPLDTVSDSLGPGIESFLSSTYHNARPAFVVIDVLMSWTKPIFKRFNIPIVSFFTSGACATVMEYAADKAEADGVEPGPDRTLPGLPDAIAMSDMDVKRRDRRRKARAGGRPRGPNMGPPKSGGPLGRSRAAAVGLVLEIDRVGCAGRGQQAGQGDELHGRRGDPVAGLEATWLCHLHVVRVAEYNELAAALAETDKSFIWVIQPGAGKPGPPANMFGGKAASAPDSEEEEGGNGSSCSSKRVSVAVVAVEQQGQHVDSCEMDKGARGIGNQRRPNIPCAFSSSSGQQQAMTEAAGQQLGAADSKEMVEHSLVTAWFRRRRGTNLYNTARIEAIGRMLGHKQLVISPPFILVRLVARIQRLPINIRVQVMRLLTVAGVLEVEGWAPQLSILSHPSTGGFLSHCGWNSTVEAICCGVPILGWPIRGDQFYDANLVAKYLNEGSKVEISDEESIMVKKIDVIRGIKAVMDDEEVGKRAMALRGIFDGGYPSTSAYMYWFSL
ncbi:hypothetical protein SASPL_143333 [Salvia splendens]|uniref:Glycosyltransferase n=1 Tax=Salvia splendens TaxID=180675 RepID=A0A8X8ZA76_SALSN|nr:hypothetical protein SASPL_143333 [Salvia splendens]